MKLLNLNQMESERLFILLNEILEAQKARISEPKKQILTNKELIKYLGVSRNQTYNWRCSGELKYCQKGRSIFYFMEDVIEFIKTGRINS